MSGQIHQPSSKTSSKRDRSPNTGNRRWAEYDADLLDNLRATKRFADASLADTLRSASLSRSPLNFHRDPPTLVHSGSGLEGMNISSSECSPMAVVMPSSKSMEASAIGHLQGAWLNECATPTKGWNGGSSPLVARCSVRKAGGRRSMLNFDHQIPTSPSDPQIEFQDLRRQTLLKAVLMKSGTPVSMEDASPAPADELNDSSTQSMHLHEHQIVRGEDESERHCSSVSTRNREKSSDMPMMSSPTRMLSLRRTRLRDST